MNKALPLACPFCGADAVGRADGPDQARPFYVRCSKTDCAGFGMSRGWADPEIALAAWNQRAQSPPAEPRAAATLFGFAKKNLIRGELIALTLDRSGVLQSDAVAFSPHSQPLAPKPRD